MASLQKRGSVYYARYWLGKKQRMICLHTRSRPMALEKLHKLESSLAKGEELPLPTKTPLSQVLSAYIAHVRAAKTKNTAKSELFYLRDVFGPICPELDFLSRQGVKKRKNMRKPASGYIEAGFLEGITTAQIVGFILARMQARKTMAMEKALLDGTSMKDTKWMEVFANIYSQTDTLRKPEDFWNAVMAHLSGIGEAIRRYDYNVLMTSAVHGLC